jgi:SAM-dependent methyltransferase
VRVLDLACGSGMARMAVGRRLITREVHYTGIDSNRTRLEPLESIERSAVRARQASDPSRQMAVNAPLGDAYALSGRIKERFIRTELRLNDPDGLTAQLAELLSKDRFDEIHVHLLHPGRHGCQPVGPRVLRAMAKYLRPGARLYHLFQHSSPFFDFQPERLRPSREGLCPAADTQADALGRNETRFRQAAARAGLLLGKCGLRWEKPRPRNADGVVVDAHKNWVTRRFSGPEPDWHTAEAHQRLAEQYSGYSRYASHFVILRKPARRSARA